MFEELKNRILRLQQAAGIEVLIRGDGQYQITVVTASIIKNKVVKEITASINDFSQLPAILKSSVPVFLVINGKGILTKIIPPEVMDNGSIMDTLLPNAHEKDFYIEVSKHGTTPVGSLLRKEQGATVINKIKEQGYKILGVSIGFSCITTIINYINNESQLAVSSFVLHYNTDRDLQNFETRHTEITSSVSNPEYEIAGQYARAHEILAFSASIRLLTDNLSPLSDPVGELINQERKEYRYYKFYKAALQGGLLFLLTLLLVNFIIYNHYFQKNKDLAAYRTVSAGEAEKAQKLLRDVQEKEQFLQQNGWLQQTKSSYLADRIAGLVPANTLLTELTIHPMTHSDFAGESIHFKKDTLLITGLCENASEVNMFMNNLKNIIQIKEIAIKSYQYKPEEGMGTFLMEIITN